MTDTQSSERQSSETQTTELQAVTQQKPILIVFSSQVDGHSRRVEGYLAAIVESSDAPPDHRGHRVRCGRRS